MDRLETRGEITALCNENLYSSMDRLETDKYFRLLASVKVFIFQYG